MKKHNQKGVSLLITLLIMAAILAIALGVSRLSLGEIKISRNTPNSLIAYYAAESGIERALYEDRVNGQASTDYPFSGCIETDICYSGDASGVSPNRTIISNGLYQDTARSVESTY
jgi:Tfp pilus assembly protein PilX